EPAVHPEQRWIEWKQRDADLLQQIDPVVPAAEVFALMQYDLLQIRWRKLRKEPLWYEKARGEEADHARRIHIGGGADLDGAPAASLQKRIDGAFQKNELCMSPDAAQMNRVHQELGATCQHEDGPDGGDHESPARSEMHYRGGCMRSKCRCRGQLQQGHGGRQSKRKCPDGKSDCGAHTRHETKKDRDRRDQGQSLPQTGDTCLRNEL